MLETPGSAGPIYGGGSAYTSFIIMFEFRHQQEIYLNPKWRRLFHESVSSGLTQVCLADPWSRQPASDEIK